MEDKILSKLSRKLIVNADDFGLSEGVNRGISEALAFGLVTSASLMVNMEASLQAKANFPSIGFHLNLTCGRPLSPPDRVPSLVNSSGHFHNLPSFLLRVFMKEVAIQEIEIEIRAQIQWLRNLGVEFTHIDSHHHIHVLPPVRDVLLSLAREYGITRIRNPFQENNLNGFFLNTQWLKRWGLKAFSRSCRFLFLKNHMFTPDHFYGLLEMKVRDKFEAFKRIFQMVPTGVSEIMCHPGYVDPSLVEVDRYLYFREAELKALTAKKLLDIIQEQGIILTSYGSF
jgi:hypothetical protein